MNKQKISAIIVIILGLLFIAFFTPIVVYLLIASVVSAIGIPLKHLIQKVTIKQKRVPDSIAALFSIAAIFTFFMSILALIGPVVVSQSQAINNINFQTLSEQIQQPLSKVNEQLVEYSILKSGENLETIVVEKIEKIVQSLQINTILNEAISITGTFFIGLFSIIFISFFFIKDDKLFTEIILIFVPSNDRLRVKKVLLKIRETLSKYFLGLLIDTFTVITVVSIACFFVGVQNAILIGFICGLLNIVPYLGFIIGAIITSALVLISSINLGFDFSSTLILKTLTVLVATNLLDAFVFQPFIYSNSVKAHPLEIFIVILMGGMIAGPVGMILAVPSYTIFRIVAKEFLGEYEFIQKLTRNI